MPQTMSGEQAALVPKVITCQAAIIPEQKGMQETAMAPRASSVLGEHLLTMEAQVQAAAKAARQLWAVLSALDQPQAPIGAPAAHFCIAEDEEDNGDDDIDTAYAALTPTEAAAGGHSEH